MKHGGDISEALANFGNSGEVQANEEWLDMSTGIAPHPYPLPPLAAASWQKLPQSSAMESMLASAKYAYRLPKSASIVAAHGTQIVIQLLPLLYPDFKRVRILGPTYSEHALCWKRQVLDTKTVTNLSDLADADVAVITNPNNPDGRTLPPEEIRNTLEQRSRRGRKLLIVDEAFADLTPEVSAIPFCDTPGMIVLRSFGKFFGLAGLRLGFAIGHSETVQYLQTALGPWAVSGPACAITEKALRDDLWAHKARALYRKQAAHLDLLLLQNGLKLIGGTSLYRLVSSEKAAHIYSAFARQGILIRKFDENPHWLRFGLPGNAANFARFECALKNIRHML